MNVECLISIIVPIYNSERYLQECIDSILSQSYSNIEVILVNDGSTDLSLEICKRYSKKDSRVKVFDQENKGVSAARNKGLDNVRGEYVAFVDSDDKLNPFAIEYLLNDLLVYKADIASATKCTIEESGRIISNYDDNNIIIYKDTEALCKSLDGDINANSVCAKLFKIELVNNIRFVEGRQVNEDGFFLFQCYLKCPTVVQHNISIYKYIIRAVSNSRSNSLDRYLDMLYFCELKKELITRLYPNLMSKYHNMEVRTNMLFLQVLCRSFNKKYTVYEQKSIVVIKEKAKYFIPTRKNDRIIIWVIRHNLYPVFKLYIYLKHYLNKFAD